MDKVRPAPAAEPEKLDPSAWDALAQRPGESLKAHTAFIDYVLMGPGRSLRKLARRYQGQSEGEAGAEKPPTTRQQTLEGWSVKFEWQTRLDAYQKERKTLDLEYWEKRQIELREKDWQAGEDLREFAAEVLAHAPQFLKTTKKLIKGGKGQPDQIVVTIGLDWMAMVRAIETASKIQRLAAGMPESHQQVDHSGEIAVNDLSVVGITPEMAAAAQAALQAALTAAQQGSESDGSSADSSS